MTRPQRIETKVAAWALLLLVASAAASGAQVVPGAGAGIGSVGADRARLAQLRGTRDTAFERDGARRGVHVIQPVLRGAWNSHLPESHNDGSLWAGRGANLSMTGGVSYSMPRGGVLVDLRIAPTINASQNRPFQIFPNAEPNRSSFSSPWHLRSSPADLPLRFGSQSIKSIEVGQSALTLTARGVAFGISSASEWWGPSIRNTLVLSNNAAGIPRAFVRTAAPVRSRLGAFDARLMVGTLTESPYFDRDRSNDYRSASGALVTFRPALDTSLTIGASRMVLSPIASAGGALSHALDALVRWEPQRFARDSGAIGTSQRTDQVSAIFARWVVPGSGIEAYGEWARTELPRSLRELLVYPQHTQGFTVGLQWADPRPRSSFLRVQGEVSNVEQTQIIPGRPAPDFYSGVAAVQGHTQRGQVLGAAAGPGSSSQFVAADWVALRWQLGIFAGRTRHENDALYRQPFATLTRHDVTIQSGARGAWRTRAADLFASLGVARRINYMFQNDAPNPDQVAAVDIQNITLTFSLTPR